MPTYEYSCEKCGGTFEIVQSMRDAALNQEIGQALMKQSFVALAGLRRDAHDRTDPCWLHTPDFCLFARPLPPTRPM